MAKYVVFAHCDLLRKYIVYVDSEDEAIDAVQNGEAEAYSEDMLDCDYGAQNLDEE